MQTKGIYILLFAFFVLGTKYNYAQQSIDSVQYMDTVSIIDRRVNELFKQISLNPEITKFQSQNDIGEALQQQTFVHINSYGLGNSSSISIRGANDDHTNVFWNGLKINSLTLGGTDISLIPFESGSEVLVETNNSSFGGSLKINSKADWKNKVDVKVRSDLSSFDNYRNTFSLKTGNDKIQFHTNTFYQTAENNFTYVDVYKFNYPVDTANHNALKNTGTVNIVFLKLKKQCFISAGSWFQMRDKELPAIMGSNELSSKYQQDKLVRHFLNMDIKLAGTDYHFAVSHSYDDQKYTDKRLPADTFLFINANYKTNRISTSFSANTFFKHGLSLHSGYFYNINMANVKEYVKKVTDHIGEIYSELKWESDFFNANVKITQPFSSFRYVRPQFFAQAGYLTKNKIYSTSISYSDKYRFPDLNDRYWNPGGNPGLKPEFGWTVNLSNNIRLNKKAFSFFSTINLYYSVIKNNIVWTPVSNVFWSPKNLKSVSLYGIETEASGSYHIKDNLFLNLTTIYTFNRARILDDETNADLKGNYLRYKPQHTFKTAVYLEQKYFGIGLNYIYTSTRFTDEENFEYFALRPYHLADMYLTFKGTVKERHSLQFIFKINNISNTSYESIRSYAQPLRYYSLSFIYNYSKHQKK